MVKKSLFARLFHRNGHDSGAELGEEVQIDAPRLRPQGAHATPGRKPVAARMPPSARMSPTPASPDERDLFGRGESVAPAVAAAPATPVATAIEPALEPTLEPIGPPAPKVSVREMPRAEELAIKLKEGFQGISSALTGIDRKIDKQQETSDQLMVEVARIPELMKDVPDASRAGMELLGTISKVLEYQGRTTGELLAKMRELPASLDEMERRFQAQVESLARTSGNADRTAKETQRQLSNAFAEVKKTVEQVSSDHVSRQEKLIDEMRRQQDRQETRVSELIQRSNSSMKLVVFLLVIAIAALLLAVYGMSR